MTDTYIATDLTPDIAALDTTASFDAVFFWIQPDTDGGES